MTSSDLLGQAGDASGIPSVVRIGGMDRESLLRSLRTQRVLLNRAAELLFEDPRFALVAEPRSVGISCSSVAALGFGHGATYGQLVSRARALGLAECPLELAAHLRLQFKDQLEAPPASSGGRAPPGALTVASCPLDDAEETPKGFYLRRQDGALWLRGYWAPASHLWHPEDRLVFARAGEAHPTLDDRGER